jgi:uncharacterized protein (TIGR02301 family)
MALGYQSPTRRSRGDSRARGADKGRMRLRFLALVPILAAAPAAAQATARGDTLVALAEVLGQSHALRQACAGPTDQYWRARMMRLMDVERPNGTLEGRLTEAFNDGYASRRALFKACSPQAKRAEAAAAARGRAIAAQLSRSYQSPGGESETASPDEMAPKPRAP